MFCTEKSVNALWTILLIDNKIQDYAALLMFCAEKSVKCSLDAIQILGGNGYINDYPTGLC